jgi:intracellular sulfur oxidation DsrE/DsrF family protein
MRSSLPESPRQRVCAPAMSLRRLRQVSRTSRRHRERCRSGSIAQRFKRSSNGRIPIGSSSRRRRSKLQPSRCRTSRTRWQPTPTNGFAGGPNSLHCAVVLYAGRSYTVVFDDAMYAKYPLGLINDEEMRPKDTSARAYWTALRRNPMADFIRPLTEQGVSLFVCNNALSGFAAELARRTVPQGDTVTREQVVAIHDELAAHFIPGTMLVPAGVAAVNAAQEARFTFLP